METFASHSLRLTAFLHQLDFYYSISRQNCFATRSSLFFSVFFVYQFLTTATKQFQTSCGCGVYKERHGLVIYNFIYCLNRQSDQVLLLVTIYDLTKLLYKLQPLDTSLLTY